MLPITGLYAALCALLLLVLSVRVSMARSKTHVSLGDGGNDFLFRRIRVQGNFVEYIPLLLIVLALLEFSGVATWYLHVYGIAVVIGRIVMIPAIERDTLLLRVLGMVGVYFPLCAGALYLLWSFFA